MVSLYPTKKEEEVLGGFLQMFLHRLCLCVCTLPTGQ